MKENHSNIYENYSECAKRNRVSEVYGKTRTFVFKSLPTGERLRMAKTFGLCYLCSDDVHLGSKCLRNRQCKIDGCLESHDPFLLVKKPETTNKYILIDKGTAPCID